MGRRIAIFGMLFSATLLFWWMRSLPYEQQPTVTTAAEETPVDTGSTQPATPPPPVAEPRTPESREPREEPPAAEPPAAEPEPVDGDPAISELRGRGLAIPVEGIEASELQDTFDDPRSGGRVHRALDIMAPRGTPVVAVETGRILSKFSNALGGNALYLIDASRSYCYYYAHLDGYAADLREGETVERGRVLGYVGSTGNAPDDAPHLHLAIHPLTEDTFWCKSKPLNPYLVFVEP